MWAQDLPGSCLSSHEIWYSLYGLRTSALSVPFSVTASARRPAQPVRWMVGRHKRLNISMHMPGTRGKPTRGGGFALRSGHPLRYRRLSDGRHKRIDEMGMSRTICRPTSGDSFIVLCNGRQGSTKGGQWQRVTLAGKKELTARTLLFAGCRIPRVESTYEDFHFLNIDDRKTGSGRGFGERQRIFCSAAAANAFRRGAYRVDITAIDHQVR